MVRTTPKAVEARPLNKTTDPVELRAALDEHAIVAITDPQGKITFANDKFCAISKYSRAELLGQDHRIINSGYHPKEFMRDLWETIARGKVWHGTIRNRAKDGSFYWVATTIVPFLNERGKPRQYISLRADITGQKLVEEKLRAAQDQLQLLLEHSPAVIYSLKVEGARVIPQMVSENIKHILGFTVEESSSHEWWVKQLHPEDRQAQIDSIATTIQDEALNTEYRLQHKSGQYIWVGDNRRLVRDEKGKPAIIVGVWTDITERKKAHNHMLRAQRLESIGTIAGGIAHDLNNALAPILMATELIRVEYPNAREEIDIVEKSARHGADMVRQLLTFAKGIEGQRLLIQPKQLLGEMEKILKISFPKNIQLNIHCPPKLHTVLGDFTQLHQVLLNLCVNARDAMPNGGTLTIEAENAEIDAIYANNVPEAKPGRYIAFRIIDTGTGIPPEILGRIFEPFFSTKGPDKGTGLGLSTVFGIVNSHGGFVRVYSQPGQGSTFAVYLPISGSSKGDTEILSKASISFLGNGETILVVDDEAGVRQMMRSVLTVLNFQPVIASNGTEALIQLADKREELRAVITDMHMPQMDGLNFVRVLKHTLPQVGIIVTSGHLNELELKEFKALGVTLVLNKPFTQEKLVEVLRTIFKK